MIQLEFVWLIIDVYYLLFTPRFHEDESLETYIGPNKREVSSNTPVHCCVSTDRKRSGNYGVVVVDYNRCRDHYYFV